MPPVILFARDGDGSHSAPAPNLAADMSADMSQTGHSTGTDGGAQMQMNHLMNMAFHNTMTDNLFFESWTPTTTGQYAGACIFLIVLAIAHRFLVAFKSVQDAKWQAKEQARSIVVAGRGGSHRNSMESVDNDPKNMVTITTTGEASRNPWTVPWRFSTELPRAILGTINTFLGFLLMLVVMTFNVGYFFSILGGVFAGEIAFGRIGKHGGH